MSVQVLSLLKSESNFASTNSSAEHSLQAGEGIEMDFVYQQAPTSQAVCAEDSVFLKAFKKGAEKSGLTIKFGVFPASTDSAYIREVGIPALGFSPMPCTPVRLHDHNEFLNERTFLDGIEVFYNIIKEIASTE